MSLKPLPTNPNAAPSPLISRISLRYDTRWLTPKEVEVFERCLRTHILERTDLSPSFTLEKSLQILRYDSSDPSQMDWEIEEAGDTGIARFTVGASRDTELTNLLLWKEYITPLRRMQAEGKKRAEGELKGVNE